MIYKLIPVIMGEIGAIEKTRKNSQQGYSFRGIDDIYSALQGPLVKHGVFFIPTVLSHKFTERPSKTGGTLIYTTVMMSFTFVAEDKSSITVTTIGEAMDSGDKSSNKAMSAALKYAVLQLFCIPTHEDNDTENHSHEVAHVKPLPARPESQPLPQPYDPSEMTPDSGKRCARCRAPMKRTKNNNAWACPNWADKTMGEHSYFKDE